MYKLNKCILVLVVMVSTGLNFNANANADKATALRPIQFHLECKPTRWLIGKAKWTCLHSRVDYRLGELTVCAAPPNQRSVSCTSTRVGEPQWQALARHVVAEAEEASQRPFSLAPPTWIYGHRGISMLYYSHQKNQQALEDVISIGTAMSQSSLETPLQLKANLRTYSHFTRILQKALADESLLK